MTLPYLTVICATYNRPVLLAEVLECYLRQDYAGRCELVILDDLGQYAPTFQDGDRPWRLAVSPQRFRTLGEKRNATAALASPQSEAYAVCDDDDLYLPHWLTAVGTALAEADLVRPSRVYHEKDGRFWTKPGQGLYHGAWGFRREAFVQVGGYPWMQSGQDLGLLTRLKGCDARQADTTPAGTRPYYVYRWHTGSPHISALKKGDAGYQQMMAPPVKRVELKPHWRADYLARVPEE